MPHSSQLTIFNYTGFQKNVEQSKAEEDWNADICPKFRINFNILCNLSFVQLVSFQTCLSFGVNEA